MTRIDAAALFREHHEALFRYLSRLTGDPDLAADAAQEAFSKLLERPPGPGETRGWLFRVGANAARMAARTRNLRLRIVSGTPDRAPMADPPADPHAAAEAAQARERVRTALEALSERERTILLMREEGFTHREIAGAVGTTTGSVGTMIARALDKLADELGPDHEEDA